MGIAINNFVSSTEDRASGAQIIDGSLKFDGSQELTFTPGSNGNLKTATWSFWVKRTKFSSGNDTIFGFGPDAANDAQIYFNSSDKIYIFFRKSSSSQITYQTTRVFRDTGWYHIVMSVDTTQASGQVQLYINGTEITEWDNSTDTTQNADLIINDATYTNYIGRGRGNASVDLDCMLSNVYLIDGQALGPEYFGYTDPLTNTWRPKKFSGSFTQPVEDFSDTLPILNTNSDGSSVTSGTRTDSLNSNWILGLAMNTSANIYTDLSPSAGDATDYSNVTASTTTSRFYGTSAYFNGTNAKLIVNDTRFDFSATDFTMETWIYVPSTPTVSETIFCSSNPDLIGSNSTAGVLVGWNSSNQLFVYVGSDTTPSITNSSTTAVSINKWHHIAIAKNGSTITLYIDGVASGTTTTSVGNSTSGLYVAHQPANDRWFEAYYQDLRVYSSAKYTANFTPPVGSVNSFYLPMDGNSPIGQDKSGNGNDWTPVNFGGSVELDKATGAKPILNTTQGGTQAGVGVFGSKQNVGYAVTVYNSGGGNKYYLDGVEAPTLTGLIRGATYTFDQTDSSNSTHPLVLATTAEGNNYGTGVKITGSPGSTGITSITIPHNAPETLYYHCSSHSGMGSSITGITTNEKLADQYASNCVLALPLVGSTGDISASIACTSSQKTMTNSGSVDSETETLFYHSSRYFDGSNDNLKTNDVSDFLSPAEYTIEGWINITSAPGNNLGEIIFDTGGGGSDPELNIYNNSGTLQMYESLSNNTNWDGAALQTGRWYHFAQVVQGSSASDSSAVHKIYIDGQLSLTNTINLSGRGSNSIACIASRTNDSVYGNFYLSDLRFYQVAKYTNNFIPASTNPDILPDTPSGVSGSSKLTKIIDGAVSFDGTGDYLNVPWSSDFELGTGDFTIEMFVYWRGDTSTSTVLAWGEDIDNRFDIGCQTANQIRVFARTGGSTFVNMDVANGISTNKWIHLAVVRNSSAQTMKLYIDGVEKASTSSVTATIPTNTSNGIDIGRRRYASSTSDDYQGFISNVRILKGTALYTSNFTPPTAPLTNVTNTKLLCCQSNTSATAAAVGGSSVSRMPSGYSYWDAGYTAGWSVASSKTSGASTSDYVSSALPASGKHYWETIINNPNTYRVIGVTDDGGDAAGNDGYQDNMSGFYYNGNPPLFLAKKSGGTSTASGVTHGSSTGINWVDGDIIQWAFDADNSKMWVGRNGTWYSGDPGAGTGEAFSSMPASPYFKLAYATDGGNSMTFEIKSEETIDVYPKANGDAAATNFNPFTTDINAVRGQESGYATLSPVRGYLQTLSNGNLTGQTAGGWVGSTVDVSSGKYYVEFIPTSNTIQMFGICSSEHTSNAYPWQTAASKDVTYYVADGRVYVDAVNTGTTSAAAVGDTISLSLDTDSRTVQIRKNNILISTKTISQSTSYMFYLSDGGGTSSATVNFGQKPFKFAPPEGFQPLNAANVRPETVITRPDHYVGIVTYTSDATARDLDLGFKPDFVWFSRRNVTGSIKYLVDSVRGIDKVLSTSHTQGAEAENALTGGGDYDQVITSLNPTGITIGTSTQINENTGTYVAWAWKAGLPSTPTTGAVRFDGTGDYLSLANSSDFSFGSGDFTVEAFVYWDSLASNGSVVGVWQSTDNRRSFLIQHSGSGTLSALLSSDGAGGASIKQCDSSTSLVAKKWHHIAFTRSGNNIRLFLDGTLQSTTDVTGYSVYNNTDDQLTVGAFKNDGSGDPIDGFVSNVRIIKGTALYTSDFTPPTAELTNVTNTKLLCCQSPTPFITGGQPILNTNSTGSTTTSGTRADSYASYLSLCIPLNGSNGGTTFTDQSPTGRTTSALTFTANGDTQTSTSQSKYYGSSGYFDGTGDYLTSSDTGSTMTVGTGDFTIELWVYWNSFSGSPVIVSAGTGGFSLGSTNDGDIFMYRNGAGGWSATWTSANMTTGRWYHIAAVTSTSGTWEVYLNGVSLGTQAGWTGEGTTSPLYIGGYGNGVGSQLPNAYIQDIRIYKGIRKYSSNFNVTAPSVEPTAAVSPSSILAAGNASATNFNPLDAFSVDGTGYSTASAAGLTGGDITPIGASVNTKSGFSIITYTGNGVNTAQTISHGLNVKPGLIILKGRDQSFNWTVLHQSFTDRIGKLNTTDSFDTGYTSYGAGSWNPNGITSSTFSTYPGTSNSTYPNADGLNYVAYCWHDVPGLQKFGSYEGNGNADGPLIELGFRPALLMLKSVDVTGGWAIIDSTRDPINPANALLQANRNTEDTESSVHVVDILSNGFKLRGTGGSDPAINPSSTVIYAAWAEAPSINLYGAQSNAR